MSNAVILELPNSKIPIEVVSNTLLGNNHYNYSNYDCKCIIVDIKINDLKLMVDDTVNKLKNLILTYGNYNIDTKPIRGMLYEYGILMYYYSKLYRYNADSEDDDYGATSVYEEIIQMTALAMNDIYEYYGISQTLELDEYLNNTIDEFLINVIENIPADSVILDMLDNYDITSDNIINIIKKSIITTNDDNVIATTILLYRGR